MQKRLAILLQKRKIYYFENAKRIEFITILIHTIMSYSDISILICFLLCNIIILLIVLRVGGLVKRNKP